MTYSVDLLITPLQGKEKAAELLDEKLDACGEGPSSLQRLCIVSAIGPLLSMTMANQRSEQRVVVSGHHNPDSVPRTGWANEWVNITVYQLDKDVDENGS